MKNYLIDASAFMILIKKADVEVTVKWLRASVILDLTVYEVGNAIWKETSLIKFLTPQQSLSLQKTAKIVLSRTDRVSSDPQYFEEILELANKEKLTFYDASYVFYAKKGDLKLITQDKQLALKGKKYVEIQDAADLSS